MTAPVLIIDDSLTVRMDLREAFAVAGFDPVVSASLAEARAILATRNVAAIVLDVLLPDGDGIGFLQELRADPTRSALPVLLLSSEAEVKDRIRGLRTGADEYVGKPYEAGYVVARARELIRDRGPGPADPAAILVIDDSQTFREELRRGLEAAGHAVVVAGTGEEGLLIAGERRPSAVLVDGMLPGIDGATVIRRLRLDAALGGVPCVLLTASEDDGAELRALEAGADAFVRKDEPIDVILARLAAVLRHDSGDTAAVAGTSLGPKKVLAVDDSPTYRDALAESLLSEGYDVVQARSGEEALELLAVQSVDCILLDLLMPGLGGEETCRRIKAAPMVRDIPLLMLTAVEDRAAMIAGLSAGADDYISKSSEFGVLKARVRAQIRRRQFEEEHRRIRASLMRKELEAAESRAARELAETRSVLVEELRRKNQELEAFSYSVSHDLRAPLRAIDGFSRAIKEEYAHLLDGKGQHYLDRICSRTRHMSALIDDLLALSRVTRAAMRQDSVDLAAIARRIANGFRERDPARAVTFDIADTPPVTGDPQLLAVALENLLGNAWKYTSKCAVATIRFGLVDRGGESVYAVSDDGAGFDMTYANKLFAPFQRLHRTDEFEGTGIGLATVQRIVSRHAGRIWAEATVGRGATFYFTIGESSTARILGSVAAEPPPAAAEVRHAE